MSVVLDAVSDSSSSSSSPATMSAMLENLLPKLRSVASQSKAATEVFILDKEVAKEFCPSSLQAFNSSSGNKCSNLIRPSGESGEPNKGWLNSSLDPDLVGLPL